MRYGKKFLMLASVCSLLVVSACTDAPRSQNAQLGKAANVVSEVQLNNFPYVLGGGSFRGATTGIDGAEPGFDSAGLLSFAFADCCNMKIGESVSDIYDNTRKLEVKEGEPIEVIEGELVFSPDKTVVAIIVETGDKGSLEDSEIVYADKSSGKIVREKFDGAKFSNEVRTLERSDIRKLIEDYMAWKKQQEIERSPSDSEKFIDPSDEAATPLELDDSSRR